LLDNRYYYGKRKGLLIVVKRKSKQQEHDKNPIDGIRMSELLTDIRLWKNKDRHKSKEIKS